MRLWTQQITACFVLLLTACSVPAGQAPPTPGEPEAGTTSSSEARPAATKMATSLRQVIEHMREDGLTAENALARRAETYSNALVRVDPQGRLHTAIVVTHIDAQVMAMLLAQQVEIERRDDATHSLHAWIPFERCASVAAFPFVRFLRPPHYASRR